MKAGANVVNFTVKRVRHSVDHGTIIVLVNDIELISYGDDITHITAGQQYYGEIIEGKASVVPDDEIILETIERHTYLLREKLNL